MSCVTIQMKVGEQEAFNLLIPAEKTGIEAELEKKLKKAEADKNKEVEEMTRRLREEME